MAKVSRYTQEMVDQYLRDGYWTRESTVDFWDRNASLYPHQEAIVDSRMRLTWLQAKQQINRLALGLLDLGFKRDEVLLIQLYNSVELNLIRLACEKAGILLAIVPYTFRHAELESVLKQVVAKGAFIPYEFRGFNYFQMFEEIQPRVQALKYIFVIGDKVPDTAISVQKMMDQEAKSPPDSPLDKYKFGPFEFEEIMTTSGTTGVPKCVEWTGCARLAQARQYIKKLNLTHNDTIAAFSPSTGAATECLVYRCPPQVAAKTVMMERFTPEEACQLIERERITVAGIVPTMIVRLLEYPGLQDHDLSSLRILVSTASLLPYQVAKEAEEKLGCTICQGYGSIDSGAVTMCGIDEPQEVRWQTVGRPFPGGEVRLLNEEGIEVPPGEVGMVTVAGPTCVGGYYKDHEATKQAWIGGRFKMGDLGVFDIEGRLKIIGRQRDIIIRGGQNIYPKEVEDHLAQHPKIAEVAIVRMPDRQMGEKACAYVVLKPQQRFTFDEMVSFLREKRIAPFKIPEELEIVQSLPLVPGGNKVDKRRLEQEIAQKLETEGSI
jgi:non-ribosomal peptide synthetase component E (peptide arylation enzyme)